MLAIPESHYGELIRAALPMLKAQNSFYEFVKQAWKIVEPKKEFIDGMHIKAMCDHLEGISRGTISQDLIMNLPPRCSKSTIFCVLWPAWDWIENPGRRFMFAAHSMQLATRDSIRCRDVIESDWYQNYWGHHFYLIKNTERHFENNHKGFRKCTSPDSRLTGEGADIICVDDLNDTTEVLSDQIRGKTNIWFSGTLSTRLNDLKRGRIIIAAQRCHELDISGHAMGTGNFLKLVLPMEYETGRKCKTIPLSVGEKPWEDPREKEGELLWPQNIGPNELSRLKKNLDTEYRIAGQLQQRPSPETGGIIKKSYFQWWKQPQPPKINLVIQSWDTALTDDDMKRNAYSACTTWGVFDDFGQDPDNNSGVSNIILLDCWRGRLEYPELRRMAQRLAADYKDKGEDYREPDGRHIPDYVLVEAKASGSPLIQDLRRAGVMAVAFIPDKYGDKIQRVRLCTPIMECKRVWLPASPFTGYKTLLPFAEKFMEQCCLFPNAEARDYVDSMSQAMLKVIYGGILQNASDPRHTHQQRSHNKNIYGIDRD
jgi:predicted phage terminase large subunit-like protein